MGGIGVEVDTAVEHGSSIFTDATLDQGLATGVLADEVGNIVNNTSNGDQTAAVLSLLNIIIPLNDGQLLKRYTPVELGALLVDLLLELLDTALLDFVGTELLEIGGETELAPDPNGPLGGVILVPFDSIAVVGGKLVVEIVVTLTESDDCGDDVIPGAVAVIEGLVTEPMGKRVDAEGGLLDKEDTEDTGVDESTHPIVPEKAGDSRREDQAHEQDDLDVMLVLPDDNGVLVEIGDVGAANALGVLLHDHPAEMAVEETLADAVGVFAGVGVAVMSAVVAGPPTNGALNGTAANKRKEDAQNNASVVRLVCPETMVAGGDPETSPEVVDNGPGSGLPLKRSPERSDAAGEGDADNEIDLVEPVSFLQDCGVVVVKLTLSQLTCLYQFAFVIGDSVMCGFFGSYLGLRFGSEVLAIGEPCLT